MKTIGIALAMTSCLAAACVAVGDDAAYMDELHAEGQEAPAKSCEARITPKDGLVLPAQTEAQWKAFMASDDTSRVRSMDDWELCLRDTACNPLAGVDPVIVDAFTESLVFRNGGLAGADYGRLDYILTYAQFMALWDKFGIGDLLFADWEGFECKSPGTCKALISHICTNNC